MGQVVPKRRIAGRYVVEEHVADGGMATVWRARDEVLARTVAVKTLRQELASRTDFRERFHREAVAAARLNHPAIVSIFDTGMDDGIAFIVMEYFEGRTVADLIRDRGPMDVAAAIALVLPVLDALAYAHAEGLVHRDIKPANILVGPGGRVKVADFGLAKAVSGQDLTTTGKVLGTVRYLSPEQVRGDDVDARSDLYSLGIVLYELVTGRAPFQSDTDIATAMMRLTVDPVPPRSVVPGLPRVVEAAILRALARAPADRFPTADSMRGSLERWADVEAGGAMEAVDPVKVRPSAQPVEAREGASTFRSWMLVPLVLILVAVAAVVGGIALGRLELGGPLGIKRAETGPATRAVKIERAQDFDPFGDDHSENPGEAPLAIDGQAATVWSTDHYNTAAFGQLKPGVGLFLDLGGEHQVIRVVVTSPVSGWQFELLPGSFPDQDARPLPDTDGSTRFTMSDSGRLEIELRPVRIPGLMVWITQLTLDPQRDRFFAEIAEVTVSGPRS